MKSQIRSGRGGFTPGLRVTIMSDGPEPRRIGWWDPTLQEDQLAAPAGRASITNCGQMDALLAELLLRRVASLKGRLEISRRGRIRAPEMFDLEAVRT